MFQLIHLALRPALLVSALVLLIACEPVIGSDPRQPAVETTISSDGVSVSGNARAGVVWTK